MPRAARGGPFSHSWCCVAASLYAVAAVLLVYSSAFIAETSYRATSFNPSAAIFSAVIRSAALTASAGLTKGLPRRRCTSAATIRSRLMSSALSRMLILLMVVVLLMMLSAQCFSFGFAAEVARSRHGAATPPWS
jgi:hypothetical protein